MFSRMSFRRAPSSRSEAVPSKADKSVFKDEV